DPIDQLGLGQTEMKAHHLRPDLLDRSARGVAEWSEIEARRRRCGIDAQFAIIGRKLLMPGTLASGVRFCRIVAEEIEADRFRRQSSELRDGLRNELRRHNRATDR